jgi:hypothetical protein
LGGFAPCVRIAADISLGEHKFQYEQKLDIGTAVSRQMLADILSLVAQSPRRCPRPHERVL